MPADTKASRPDLPSVAVLSFSGGEFLFGGGLHPAAPRCGGVRAYECAAAHLHRRRRLAALLQVVERSTAKTMPPAEVGYGVCVEVHFCKPSSKYDDWDFDTF